MSLQKNMIGKVFAHKANDAKPILVGKLIRFEKIHDFNVPVLSLNETEFLCAGILFEYTEIVGKTLNLIPADLQWDFLKSLKLSFNDLREIQNQRN